MKALMELEKTRADEVPREKIIIRTSMVGIVTNLCLAGFKAVIGVLSNSIAIVLDAVNNFSDAGSSLITIIGTKLAGKEPDKEHPFGHGRIEYLSAMLIAVIILYAGVTSLVESVKQIITPEMPDYSRTSLMIIMVAVVVKIFLGRYVKKIGVKVKSSSLVNSGEDAILDAVISFSTLIAAGIFLLLQISLEAWLGLIISLLIIKSGLSMLREMLSQILGESGDMELAKQIYKTVADFDDVVGAYDLVLNNYGPDSWNGSIHIEVPDTYSMDKLDQLTRNISVAVMEKHQVMLTAIGAYSVNTKDKEAARMRRIVEKIALGEEFVKQVHGFYLLKKQKTMRFDIVVSFKAGDRQAVYQRVVERVREAFPDFELQVALDADFTEG